MSIEGIAFDKLVDKTRMNPLGDNVMVMTLEGGGLEATTDSGIIYSDNKRGPIKVLVVKTGPDVKEVEPRDIVIWDRQSSLGDYDGLGIIKESSIMIVLGKL